MQITRDEISDAYRRIAPHVRHTPLLHLGDDPFGLGCGVTFKLEFLQHAGSFKSRGAFNTLLSHPLPPSGVTAASGGNHGAAVAFAARKLGVPAKIFVPEISSPIKIATIKSFGAEVVVGGARYDDAQTACNAYAQEFDALLVHPYNAPDTLAGQGTIGLEWEQDGPKPDTVLIACGGGGLISGIATWWQDQVKLVGVEQVAPCPLMSILLRAIRSGPNGLAKWRSILRRSRLTMWRLSRMTPFAKPKQRFGVISVS